MRRACYFKNYEAPIYGLKRLLAEAIVKSQAEKPQTSVCGFFECGGGSRNRTGGAEFIYTLWRLRIGIRTLPVDAELR